MSKWSLVFGFLIITIFLIVPLSGSGVPDTHDGTVNIARIAAFYKALSDGHIPPRWAGGLNYGFGTPVLSFFYPLTGYLGSLLYATGLSFEQSFTMLVIMSVTGAWASFYFWTKKLFKNNIAFLVGAIYALIPYQLLNIYVRGDIGELLAFAIVPIVFGSIERVRKKPTLSYVLIGGFAYALLILSHNIFSLLFTPVIVGYAFVSYVGKRSFLATAAMGVLGLSLSFYFWFPALYELQYTHGALLIGSMFSEHYLSLGQIVHSDWGYGADVSSDGGQAPQLGSVLFLLFLGSIYVFGKVSKLRKYLGYWYFVFAASIFFILAISKPVWDVLPLLPMIQFPWRIVSVASFSAVVLVGYFFNFIAERSRFLPYALFATFVVSSLFMIGPKGLMSETDEYYLTYPHTTCYHGQTTLVWTAGDAYEYPKAPVEILKGKAEVMQYIRRSHQHKYILVAQDDVRILDNTVYFPGWKVFVDDKEVDVEFQDSYHRGLITFEVSAGTHDVYVRYTETKARKMADIVSLATAAIFIGYFGYQILAHFRHLRRNET